MSLLLAFAVLSIAVSFVCSILEAALLSITPSYIAQQKQEHPKRWEKLKVLKDHIDQPLAAILTLNTVAHTVGATGVGAQVVKIYGDGFLGIASAIMTLLILVFSEIMPKTIGARYWVLMAPALPSILNGLIFILKPAIWMSDQIMKLFGGKPPENDIRLEIKALSLLGRELDKIDEDEQRVISNVLDLHEINVRQIMTPRVVCQTLAPDQTVAEFIEQIQEHQFSRYPVLDADEAPLGILFRHDVIRADEGQRVANLMKPATIVTDRANVESVMTRFIRERQHMFLVYDEYGSWLGVVTMEDVIEALIGQPIMDESDDIPNLRRHAKRRWKKRLQNLTVESEAELLGVTRREDDEDIPAPNRPR